MTSDPDRNHWAQGFKSNPIAVSNRTHAALCRIQGCSRSSHGAKVAVDDHEDSASSKYYGIYFATAIIRCVRMPV